MFREICLQHRQEGEGRRWAHLMNGRGAVSVAIYTGLYEEEKGAYWLNQSNARSSGTELREVATNEYEVLKSEMDLQAIQKNLIK